MSLPFQKIILASSLLISGSFVLCGDAKEPYGPARHQACALHSLRLMQQQQAKQNPQPVKEEQVAPPMSTTKFGFGGATQSFTRMWPGH